jgi:hypothetical protein
MLSPKIKRKYILLRMCINPPCINMEDTNGKYLSARVSILLSTKSLLGIRPYWYIKLFSSK